MAVEHIEISKQGIKISYSRFLADSAAGFLLIIIAILTYNHAGIQLFKPVSKEVSILLCLLLFLISTPLGLTLNALSWALLGWCQILIERKLVDNESFLIKGTKNELLFQESRDFYDFSKENWSYVSSYIEHLISIHDSYLIEP